MVRLQGTPKLHVILHAAAWPSGHNPSDTEYAAALSLARPLLREVARALGERLVLRKLRPRRPPSLSPQMAAMLDRATIIYQARVSRHGPQQSVMAPQDQVRFWRFVRAAHARRITLAPDSLREHLAAMGLNACMVSALVDEYRIGRQVLALDDEPWVTCRIRRADRVT